MSRGGRNAVDQRGDADRMDRHRKGDFARAGIAAYERGDWRDARRLLREAVESDSRKQMRVRAGEILVSLEPDRFALKIAGVLALLLSGLFLWLVT